MYVDIRKTLYQKWQRNYGICTNDILDTYFETSKAGKREIVEGFGAASDLFTREVKQLRNGKHFKTEIMILNANGTTHLQTDYH